ncbi:MAG TPA: exonuclease domain-containing protein [Clostridia bacterium]|nr:exonuclease domain-containing protein [Clostridia bacterium]
MKINNYTIVDVETASRRTPSICSLGLVHVSGGKIVASHHYYIKPPGRFEYWNIKIHGIEPYKVKTAPRFAQIWPEIKKYCENSIIIAHNASFDLGQISASLQEAKIAHPDFYYIDTVKMAHRVFPDFPKYNLAYLSLVMDVDLGNHHDALSDATATHGIFDLMQEEYPLQRSNISIYRGSRVKTLKRSKFKGSFDQILKILRNYQADEVLKDETIEEIKNWLNEVEEFKRFHPVSELLPRLNFLLQRGVYDEGVYWIIQRLAMNYYREKKRIEPNIALKELLVYLKSNDSEKISFWLEENFQLRDEFLFNELWRALWEFHFHKLGKIEELISKTSFYLRPYDDIYSKEKVAGKKGMIVGSLSPKKMKYLYHELDQVGASLGGNNPRKVDFLLLAPGKTGLDYTPRLRKILKLKEKGGEFTLLKVGSRK